MNGRQFFGVTMVLALVLALVAGLAQAQGPAGIPLNAGFTYQGRLKSASPLYRHVRLAVQPVGRAHRG